LLCGVLYAVRVGLWLTLGLVRGLSSMVAPPPTKLVDEGTWACVTGATDGIGRAYALELAKHGCNVLLISRTESKLAATAAEVRELGVDCEYLPVDMSAGEEIYPTIEAFFEEHEVSTLINNVGASYDHAEYLAELPQSKLQQLINMNIQTVTFLSHMVLPKMTERGFGTIVNVGSFQSVYPCGLYAVYSASKSYVDVFSRALAQEYGPRGVTVQSLMPQFVVSKLSKMRKSSLTVPTPETYAAAALSSVGRELQTTGYWPQQAQWWALSLLPDWVVERLLWSMHYSIYKRAMKKKAAKES